MELAQVIKTINTGHAGNDDVPALPSTTQAVWHIFLLSN